jgi:hypothetical protein
MNSRPHIGARACGTLLLAALVSGCGAGLEEMFFVKPGTYDYDSCADLAKATKAARQREEELKTLIERAEQESFGVFVAATAYRTQYLQVKGNLKLLAQTAQSKNCAIDSDTDQVETAVPVATPPSATK